MDGKRFLFEVYSDTNTHIKGCKKNYTGEVVQGRHKTYRYKNTKQLKKNWKKEIKGKKKHNVKIVLWEFFKWF